MGTIVSLMVNETTREIARRVRGIRDVRGVTDVELAARSGIPRSTLQRRLDGDDFTITELQAISDALEVTLESFLRDQPKVAA